MRAELESRGADLIGPFATLPKAFDAIERGGPIDGAILDVNLQGEMVFPLADALFKRNVPFVFATGYDSSVIPAKYAKIERFSKPVSPVMVATALFGQTA